MINTHAHTRKNPNQPTNQKKKALKYSLFPLDITLDLLRAMTLCHESQAGDSEGVLLTKHLLGVSGYERRSHFCCSVPCLLSHVPAGDIVCVRISKCSENELYAGQTLEMST